MNKAVSDCLVTGFEALVQVLDLPDADDRHVLAVAIRAYAAIIVTFNLKDFPAEPRVLRWRMRLYAQTGRHETDARAGRK